MSQTEVKAVEDSLLLPPPDEQLKSRYLSYIGAISSLVDSSKGEGAQATPSVTKAKYSHLLLANAEDMSESELEMTLLTQKELLTLIEKDVRDLIERRNFDGNWLINSLKSRNSS